jgi:hypothetical protein
LSSDVGLFIGVSGCGALIQIVGSSGAFVGIAVALFAGAVLTASVGDTRRSTSARPMPVQTATSTQPHHIPEVAT